MLPGSSDPAAGPAAKKPAAAAAGPRDRTLVSVVWCRQVDNEAESPGYTTVPTDFPGRRETLEQVRIVGNLAINAADTHDYWDPDPSNKLAYYHNLFLYTANGGAYLCLGRMFLSTEDRPRLGMKTLVLDAKLLLEQDNLGTQLRRWHASMGNPSRTQAPPGKVDPGLMAALWSSFSFTGTDPSRPTLGLVSDNFHDAVETILTLLEKAPSVVGMLSGILAFPYFLPSSRVNLSEFSETFPLNLALLRIPRSEAGGEHHQKRVAAWSALPVELLDLTQGTAAYLASHPPPGVPVSWWARGDRDDACREVRRAIDAVELPRFQDASKSLDKIGGAARRKTLARVGGAVGAVARVLERPVRSRGSLDAPTQELARPYLEFLRATPPGPAPGPPAGEVAAEGAVPPPPVAVEIPRTPPMEAEPPWRRPPRLRVDRAEVVGVPRDAPGSVPPGEAGGEVALGAPARAPGGASAPAAAGGDPGAERGGSLAAGAQLPAGLLDDLRAYVDQRVAQLPRARSGELEPDVLGKFERELDRRMDVRASLVLSPEALDARIVEVLARRPPPDPKLLLTDDVRASLAQVVGTLVEQRMAQVQAASAAKAATTKPAPPPEFPSAKVDERVLEALGGQGSDKRAALLLDQRIQQVYATAAAAERKELNDRLEAILKELQGRAQSQKELESAIRSEVRFLDEKLQTLMGRLIPLLRKTWLKIDELEKRPAGGPGASDAKMKKLREELWGEMKRLEQDMAERTRRILDRVEGNMQNQGKLWLSLVGQLSTLTEQRRDLERVLEESREDLEPLEGVGAPASEPTPASARSSTARRSSTGASSSDGGAAEPDN